MSKSVKMRTISKLLKKNWGRKRFYKGKGRLVKKSLSSRNLDILISRFSIKPGDVIHDCDGFNHEVSGFRDLEMYAAGSSRATSCYYPEQFEFVDGRLSCGCPFKVEPAATREQVEAWYLEWINSDTYKKWAWHLDNSEIPEAHEALRAGEHICDERGILLPEFREGRLR